MMTYKPFIGITLILGICCLSAEKSFSDPQVDNISSAPVAVLSMTHRQVLNFAKEMISKGQYENARVALLVEPYEVKELEIERLYLLAQIDTLEQKYDDAISIYHFILDYEPNIANIRFRLAELYLKKKAWWRADYHYRLALADKETPAEVQNHIRQALYYIRQNKNWNIWFNFGISPDSNINNADSGEQCVMTIFGVMCNTLDDPEKDVGYNITVGGDYEFRLSDHWRLRHEILTYNSFHENKDYNDIYLAYTLGGRYIYERGDIFFGPMVSRRYIGNKAYNYSVGLKISASYDISRQLNAKLDLHYTPTYYDDYNQLLNGDVKGTQTRLFYALDSSKYILLKGRYEYEDTKNRTYTNDRIGCGIGFGIELPWGFRFYTEPSVQYTHYKGERWTVKNYRFIQMKEHDTTTKYLFSLSNRKISAWGIIPTLSYTYSDKRSNIPHRGYNKSVIELSFSKGF